MTYFIGVDFGTGSTKAVAVSTDGLVLYSTQVHYPTLVPQPGYNEQAPELIWQAFIKCIQRVVEHLNTPPLGIVFSSAMHSLIVVNDEGKPLTNLITWADNRSAEVATKIKNSSIGESLYKETGTPIHAMSPLCKIIWLRENEPKLFSKAFKYISIKEYIWFNLFGTYEVDYSIASATGLFDIQKLQWNEAALTLTNISVSKLSLPVNTSFNRTASSEVLQQLHLSNITLFYVGASDGCLANLGSFATQPGKAALTIGTSGAIRVASTAPTFNTKAMTFNYLLDKETFISGGPINSGGVVLKWYIERFLKKELKTALDYEEVLQDLELTPSGADGLIFLPYIFGERAPLWSSEACGVFFGITALHTQAHFTRAVVEGISLALFNICQILEEAGLVVDEISVSGGFVHSTIWLQLLANIFGKPILLINTEDASALGAVYLGMKAMGLISSYDALKPSTTIMFQADLDKHLHYRKNIAPVFQSLSRNLLLDMTILHDLKKDTQLT